MSSMRETQNNRATWAGRAYRISGCEWFAIVVLLLLAFVLRVVALTHVPPGLHNDELVDIKTTESVAGGRLAVFFPEDTGHEVLYYYFAAPFMRAFGSTAFAMRLPAVCLGMVGMCVIWILTRRLMGPVVALTALTGSAISFLTVEFGRVVLHVVMEVPLAALAAYCFWRARSASGWRALTLWAMSGVWLGLSINAYTAARILPAIFVAFGVVVLFVDRPAWRRWWSGIAITLVVAAVIVLPLLLYLVRNPAADQLTFFDVNRPLLELRKGNLAPLVETLSKTLGMFAFVGDPLPYFDVPGRPIFEPVGAFLLLVGMLIALWRWRQPEYVFVLLWFFLALVPGILSQPTPSYTRTIGVQVVLFAMPGIAVAALVRRQRHVIVYSALVILFIGNLAWTVRDYFTVWPAVGTVRFWYQAGLKAVADWLQSDADPSPVAVCVPDQLIDERDPWWKPAWQHMRYLLHRPDLALRYYNCADAMVLIDGPARYAFPDVADADALSQFPVYSRMLAAADPDLVFLPRGPGIIVRSDPMLDPLPAELAADSMVAWAPEVGEVEQPARVPVRFGDDQSGAEFLGYNLSLSSLEPGDSFDLVTCWHVVGDLPPQLSQFTHVLNAQGTIVAQQDRLALTSASLRAGDIFVQTHHVTLPGDLEEGQYALTIGLYTPADGMRLRITQVGQPRGDRLWLRSIQVEK